MNTILSYFLEDLTGPQRLLKVFFFLDFTGPQILLKVIFYGFYWPTKTIFSVSENTNLLPLSQCFSTFLGGGGRNVEFQNVDRPKISERRNGLFS